MVLNEFGFTAFFYSFPLFTQILITILTKCGQSLRIHFHIDSLVYDNFRHRPTLLSINPD
ncbi:hypothetical protein BLOT_008923 [Blomia tropicalis]|nr:hypothetical protein BLOT_008923 [Blomia tropicalis]